MNIESYADYFHDGSVIAIELVSDELVISMASAELNVGENIHNLPLSEQNGLKGKLHFSRCEYIKENTVVVDNLKMEYDSGMIMDLEFLNANVVVLQVMWENFPFKEHTDLITYEIKAERIYWENIPDLFDPWW